MGLSESTLAKMPHCWKSHVTAHFLPTLLQPPPSPASVLSTVTVLDPSSTVLTSHCYLR